MVKSQTLSEWIKRQSQLCCLPHTHFQFKDTSRLKAKRCLPSPLLPSIMLESLASTMEPEEPTKCVTGELENKK